MIPPTDHANSALPELFRQQAALSAEAVAVSFEGETLTYRQLAERAGRLADFLRGLGVGPETLIALCLERGPDLIVAILGILEAGAAYVPCDPEAPAERLTFILRDTAAPILLTSENLLPRLGEQPARIVCLDRDGADIAAAASSAEIPPSTAENLAYVIYTSGSTGVPKGVCVTHRNVVRLFTETDAWFRFGPSSPNCHPERSEGSLTETPPASRPADVWTLFHSYAFDFSVWEIWGALLYGGRLVIVPRLTTRAPDAFLDLLIREKVTVLNQTPSAFRQLMAAEAALPQPAALALRYVVFGGEALDLPALRPWFDRHGDAQPRLINMYGITETTVHVTYRPLTAADAWQPASLIGQPIPDLTLHVLDEARQPCAPGVTGELHVGGAGLARGYLRRPELTAERFFEHTGRRLYKTGDLARWLPDGDLEYLVRCDLQVKIRGHRVELGEIEARLREFPGVRDAVVLLRTDTPDDARLAAYLVAATCDATALREFLATKLPAYMVPASFQRLEALPLTINGKLDRAALPAPQLPALALIPLHATPLETTIADLWREALNLPEVSLDHSFFELGGHSLLLLKVHGRLRAILRRDLAITTLFQYPTIRALARHLEAPEPAATTARDRAQSQRAALARLRPSAVKTLP